MQKAERRKEAAERKDGYRFVSQLNGPKLKQE